MSSWYTLKEPANAEPNLFPHGLKFLMNRDCLLGEYSSESQVEYSIKPPAPQNFIPRTRDNTCSAEAFEKYLRCRIVSWRLSNGLQDSVSRSSTRPVPLRESPSCLLETPPKANSANYRPTATSLFLGLLPHKRRVGIFKALIAISVMVSQPFHN